MYCKKLLTFLCLILDAQRRSGSMDVEPDCQMLPRFRSELLRCASRHLRIRLEEVRVEMLIFFGGRIPRDPIREIIARNLTGGVRDSSQPVAARAFDASKILHGFNCENSARVHPLTRARPRSLYPGRQGVGRRLRNLFCSVEPAISRNGN